MTPQRKLDLALTSATALLTLSGIFSVPLAQASESAGGGSCQYDRAKLLAMDYQVFDQTPDQGWRTVAAGDKCLVEAADLIRDWRTARNFPHPMLYWHEGQLRALDGAAEEAVSLMNQSRPLETSITGWKEYVDATIAFLRKDRVTFDKAKAALAAIPQAPYLGVVDRLGQCFGRSYKQSYRACEK